jgi:Methyltransferase domain
MRSGRDEHTELDGLPVPPPRLRVLVAGTPDQDWFLRGGKAQTDYLRELLAAHGRPMESFGSLLDFGWGCGRMLRWWRDLTGEVHGCDYNVELVAWTRDHLPFAHTAVNELAPPLPYESERFDFLYALSIFTHLTVESS